jgi:hypothetical protein
MYPEILLQMAGKLLIKISPFIITMKLLVGEVQREIAELKQ